MMRRRLLLPLLLSILPATGGCPNPAAPPGPPAEIPSALTIPHDLSLEVTELEEPSPAALKVQTVTNSDIRNAIDGAVGIVEETNLFLDRALSPIGLLTIPVDTTVTTFSFAIPDEMGTDHSIKIDFGLFDLNGDGFDESCSGCTCPVGCAPDLAACPTEVPADQLHPICIRLWVDGARYLAGTFDRVPTADNPESGRLRLTIPSGSDLGGSALGIVYDHRDPENRTTDLSDFLKDVAAGETDFFERRRTHVSILGPDAEAKKSANLSAQFFDDTSSTLRFQTQYFANLDFILLETLADGSFGKEGALGIADITPPICAQISTANPVSDILCSDLGLSLAAGDFVSLPELTDVQLPPASEFPETPTF
jgi:hypothetical protein